MKIVYQILSIVVIIVSLNSCGQSTSREEKFVDIHAMKMGDNLEWAAPNYDDSNWLESVEPVANKGVFWSRLKTSFSPTKNARKGMGIKIGSNSTYEAYWDGQYIGTNGDFDPNSVIKKPGKYFEFFHLPDSLVGPGEHVLALRAEKSYVNPHFHSYAQIDNYFNLLRDPLQLSKYMFLFAGAFLMTAIYFLILFFTQKKEYSFLLFSVICLIFFGLLIMEHLKLFYQYPYTFQRTRMELIGLGHLLLSILVPVFFLLQFRFPKPKILLGSLAIVLILVELELHYSYDFNAIIHNLIMWLFSSAIVIYACYKKMSGAYVVLASLIVSIAIIFFVPFAFIVLSSPFDLSLFIGFTLIVLSMLYLMSIRGKEQRREYEASRVHSERLKNELLKKNIKPHFIMNTLTSLMDWVEESPKEGVKFIGALADEFEVLNQIADYKQIPIGQEVKLCKSHLEIMSFRKEIKYLWEESGIDDNEIIPPAIIHTAVENGVSHSIPNKNGIVTFKLIFEKNNNFKQYTLQTFAKNRNYNNPNIKEVKDGTGIKYIKARLQESYENNWEVISRPFEKGWETIIKINKI